MSLVEQVLSQIPGNPSKGLLKADALWQAYREKTRSVPEVVQTAADLIGPVDYDLVIAGGTLGILLGAGLAQRGWRVALIERGKLRGRAQEWNISRQELQTFVTLGLLTEQELQSAIATQYNPARICFNGGDPVWVKDVLNIGVDPIVLLDTLKQKFLAAGGELLEETPFHAATVHPDGVQIKAGEQTLQARLLVDAMGHFSPLVQQARQGQAPDAVCLVVGTCATGFVQNNTGDLITTFTPIQNQCQYFWEAFPARDGRTTYLFTYLDAEPSRPSLEALFEDYLRLLPAYQQVSLEQLTFQRALFGFFPCYQNSPLSYPWGRTLPIGDSSGSQSPLSFGGFGAMVRHLERLTRGVDQALRRDLLGPRSLSWLQPYQPNLSVTWLFQKAMSVGVDQRLPENQINQLLSTIFQDMAALGDSVLQPFLQDVVQFPALAKTLLRTSTHHPALVAKILPQVGIPAVVNWTGHYAGLAAYSALNPLTQAIQGQAKQLPDETQYFFERWRDALVYGSGGDYESS